MRAQVLESELFKIQKHAYGSMEIIQERYEGWCHHAWKNESLWQRFKCNFKYPLSFRMFHYGEFLMSGDNAKTVKHLRRTWHSFWWFQNEMPMFQDSDNVIQLDSFEFEAYNYCRKWIQQP